MARRPLSLLELSWAVELGSPTSPPKSIETLAKYSDEMQIFKLLQPFLGPVRIADVKTLQVKLVHQSLKELILQSELTKWRDAAIGEGHQSRLSQQQRRKELEGALLRLSVQYLLFDEFNELDIFSSQQRTAEVLHELPGFGVFDDSESNSSNESNADEPNSHMTNDNIVIGNDTEGTGKSLVPGTFDPCRRGFGEFYAYAACFWLDHFKGASTESLALLDHIANLCRPGTTTLENWVTMHCRPECTIAPKFKFAVEHQFLDPLVVVFLDGPREAVDKFLSDYECYEYVGKESHFIVAGRLIHQGSADRLDPLLLHPKLGADLRTISRLEDMMYRWTAYVPEREAWEKLFQVILPVFISENSANDILCAACRSGCLAVVQMLFEEASRNPGYKRLLLQTTELSENEMKAHQKMKQQHLDPHQSVGEAARRSFLSVLRYLLEQDGIDAHIRYHDALGFNVFHAVAARDCNPEAFKLLIPRFKEGVHEMCKKGDTPLDLVVFRSVPHVECVKILLTLGGADARGACKDPHNWDSPFRRAARGGHIGLCRVMIEHGGVDPRSVLRDDGTRGLRDEFIDLVSDETRTRLLDMLYSYIDAEAPIGQ